MTSHVESIYWLSFIEGDDGHSTETFVCHLFPVLYHGASPPRFLDIVVHRTA